MIERKLSEQIMLRLKSEALESKFPNKRLGTLGRLEKAIDAIESGEAAKIVLDPSASLSRKEINQTNIEIFAKAMNWQGPVRNTISREKGLNEYMSQRVAECNEQKKPQGVTHESAIEARLLEVKPIEIQQFFRQEVEKRRSAEHRLHLIVNGVRQLPGIDFSTLIEVASGKHYGKPKSFVIQDVTSNDRKALKNLLARFRDDASLIGMGLQRDGGDIVTPQQAEVILESELDALERLLTQANLGS